MGSKRFSQVILTVLAVSICLCLPVLFGAAPAKPVSAQEQKFINEAWNINTLEVRLGQMAETKADNADVKTFAKRMASDHTRLNEELSKVAAEAGATMPKELGSEHQGLIDRLNKLSGKDFDKDYMDTMLHGHRSAVAAFEDESKQTTHTAADKWASKALLTLKEHLTMAEKIGKEVGAPAANEPAARRGG